MQSAYAKSVKFFCGFSPALLRKVQQVYGAGTSSAFACHYSVECDRFKHFCHIKVLMRPAHNKQYIDISEFFNIARLHSESLSSSQLIFTEKRFALRANRMLRLNFGRRNVKNAWRAVNFAGFCFLKCVNKEPKFCLQRVSKCA